MTNLIDFEVEKAARTLSEDAISLPLDGWAVHNRALEAAFFLGEWLASASTLAKTIDGSHLAPAASLLASVHYDLRASGVNDVERLIEAWAPRVISALADSPSVSRDDICLLASVGVAQTLAPALITAFEALRVIERLRS